MCLKRKLSRKISTQIQGVLPGDTFRDLNYRWYTSDDEWTRVYLPYWRFSFDYQGASHMALTDGRRAEGDHVRIDGRLPTDVELRRNVNENLKPLWLSLGVGAVLAFVIASIGGSAAIVPWLLGVIAVAVSGVGLMAYKRRHEALSSAELLRAKAADRLLLVLERDGSDSGAIEEHRDI